MRFPAGRRDDRHHRAVLRRFGNCQLPFRNAEVIVVHRRNIEDPHGDPVTVTLR